MDAPVARSIDSAEDLQRPAAPGGPPRHLLNLEFALVNVVALALAIAAWLQDWLDDALTGYGLWMCLLIAGVFVFGLAVCGLQLWRVGAEIDALHAGRTRANSNLAWYLARLEAPEPAARQSLDGLLRLRLGRGPSSVRHVAGMLVLLGLIGTVVGFLIALSGVDPQKVPSPDNVAPMVARLINGMSIALYTTLTGSVLHVWLMVTQRILVRGSLALYAAILDAAAGHVRR